MKRIQKFFLICIPVSFLYCGGKPEAGTILPEKLPYRNDSLDKKNQNGIRTAHVLVALCDNRYQGIVPVGSRIGNGQDPANNLYWGCDYGVKTHFKRKISDWALVATWKNGLPAILERILFKHKTRKVYLLADAYDGRFIKETVSDFLAASAGKKAKPVIHGNDTLYFHGASNLIAYIGHDGLMDFSLPLTKVSADTVKRETIILACYSKNYFAPHLKPTNAHPLLWTTGLMAPEAYTLYDALDQWIQNKTPDTIRAAAVKAYARYQKCGARAAGNLLITGW